MHIHCSNRAKAIKSISGCHGRSHNKTYHVVFGSGNDPFVHYILVICCGNVFQNTFLVYDSKSTDACLGIIFPLASIPIKLYQNEFEISSFRQLFSLFHLNLQLFWHHVALEETKR